MTSASVGLRVAPATALTEREDAEPDGDDGADGDGEGERRVRDGAQDDTQQQERGDDEQHG